MTKEINEENCCYRSDSQDDYGDADADGDQDDEMNQEANKLDDDVGDDHKEEWQQSCLKSNRKLANTRISKNTGSFERRLSMFKHA